MIARGWAARLIPALRPPVDGVPFATFTPPADGEEVVWRACHTTDCAHLTRRHTIRNGTATCHECSATGLDHQ